MIQVVLISMVLMSWPAASQGDDAGQEAEPTENGLVYQRKVQLPQGPALPAIVMTEFLTHGELAEGAENLMVLGGRREPVPWKVLQAGPGDFCRIAFQTIPRQHLYKIYYGGKAAPPQAPAWTARAGLLLETRRMTPCDFNHFQSVREAFEKSKPYGGAFVSSVFHRYNPFWPEPEPFLSAYRGTIRIDRGGAYRFFTSSQDCSFLRIDGKPVVAAPGWHGPAHQARFQGEVNLSPGPHEFEYLHGASGPDACMVAAWQPPGVGKPEPIPPEAFGAAEIARLPAPSVKLAREFSVEIQGDVPMAESAQPLVRVQFRQVSNRGSTSKAKVIWDFGDGQTSNQPEPVHVYLQPGIYTVSMKALGDADTSALVNRVAIHRALLFVEDNQKADQLASYLGLLEKYHPAKLEPGGLLQLVRAFEQAGQTARAARAGQAGILVAREPTDSEAGRDVVRLVVGLLRDPLDEPEAAFTFSQGAAKWLRPEAWKAECELEAAELALCPLLRTEPAKTLLDSAAARLAGGGEPMILARLHRLQGDWYARKGDRPAATAAYARAVAVLRTRRSAAEHDAWRGALSRSTEEFLRSGALDRARDELRRWQEEYPGDKAEGYLTYLQAHYWACGARSRWPQAIALANDLLGLNPDSPYADRLAYLTAECEERQGDVEKARAAYQALITDYPGSPLVAEARKKLTQPVKP